MDKDLCTNFNIEYENNITSNYLVIKTGPNQKTVNYQTQMLLNNKIDGILDFNMNYIDQGWNFYYDITSKCTLSSFMSRKQFNRDEFLITLLRMIHNINNIKTFLLKESSILLDSDQIYVEPENNTVYFVYLPFPDYNNDFKAFFINLIVNQIKFENEISDNYVQKILEIIKSDLFSLSSLKQVIEKLLGDEIKKSNFVQQEPEPDKVKSDIALAVKKQNIKGTIKIPQSRGNKADNLETGKIKTNSNIKYEILLQILFLALFIIVASSSFVRLSENPKTTLIFIFVLFLLLDILIIRIMNEQRRRKSEKSNYNVLNYISDRMKGLQSSKSPSSKPEPVPKPDFYRGETVIIKRSSLAAFPVLKEKEGEDLIKIDKESLLIGRMDNFVDYVINSNAIGKIHAEIMKEGGAYYIMDCNSRNGTFVNGNRLLPNTKNKINNNDEVRLANKEYVFVEAGI